MNKTHTQPKASARQDRAKYIRNGAIRCAISQGYSQETAEAFAVWAQDYAPEVQSFSNLFDYYMMEKR